MCLKINFLDLFSKNHLILVKPSCSKQPSVHQKQNPKPKQKYLLSTDSETDTSLPDIQAPKTKPKRKINLKRKYELSSDSESSEEKPTKKSLRSRKKRKYELSSDSDS